MTQKTAFPVRSQLLFVLLMACIVPLAGAADTGLAWPGTDQIRITITHPADGEELWVGDALYPEYTVAVSGRVLSPHGIRNLTISDGRTTKACTAGEISGNEFSCQFIFPYNARSVAVNVTDNEGKTSIKEQDFSFRFDLPPPPLQDYILPHILMFLGGCAIIIGVIVLGVKLLR